MGTILDIMILVLLGLGVLAGFKKGLIKTAVTLIGLVAILIISYTLKGYLADFLIDMLPFFEFSGTLEGLTTLNILIYNAISFIVIFVVLYCVLNVILAVTGFIDTLLKFTIIWVLPSKIGGALLGFVESWVGIFIVLFIMSQFSVFTVALSGSKVAHVMFDYTPIIGPYLGNAVEAGEKIYDGIKEYRQDGSKNTKELNLFILQNEISYGIISKEKATELIETGKIEVGDVMFG